MNTALRLDQVSSGYGAAIVLRDISLEVGMDESIAIMGKNGMGKSTLLKTIMGYLPKKSGSVFLLGENISSWKPYRIARLGVGYAAQEHSIFADLSVYDNLSLGLKNLLYFKGRFDEILRLFPVFEDRLAQQAGTLSGGEQKMLLVARTLILHPKVIILDEITEGLQPSVIERLAAALVYERKRSGTSMLIIEQNIPFALKVADRYLIMKQGELIDRGNTGDPGAAASVLRHFQL
ncbi:MAG: ABC transporter ATP-binding protein [Deltaproteobacteria bacterium]|jgi:branched-chain amino acid transport system ATP-binding protein|nr:ABC transporter ATP-binding protein [Deltaproteobacteria bacterium]